MIYEIYDYDGFKRAIEEICARLSSHAISEEKVFDCRLVVSELMANVLQHSGSGAHLHVEVEEKHVQISVKAEQVFCPPSKVELPRVDAERGRGIYLVDSLCSSRTFTTEGKIVVKISI
jgi:anti-sigma regulatory factor (Ser/Thr protein kinase)